MLYLLYTLFILSAFVLIVVILLQPGKADAGALFSSSISSTAFGPRGTASLLSKITIGAAAAFMLIALILSSSLVGTRSVLQSVGEDATPAPTQQASPATEAPAAVPPAPADSPAAPAASPAATQ